MNIVVLAGGLSTEREVSFVTGNNVTEALRKNGHRVILLDRHRIWKQSEKAAKTKVLVCLGQM